MTARIGASMWVLLSFAPGCALAAEADLLSGRYGHDASEPAYQAVWEVSRQDQGWLARVSPTALLRRLTACRQRDGARSGKKCTGHRRPQTLPIA